MAANARDLYPMPPVAPHDENDNPHLDAMLDAMRSRDVDAVQRLGPTAVAEAQAAMARSQQTPKPVASTPALPRERIEEGKRLLTELDRACPDAAADEKLLNRLAAGEIPVVLTLQQIERELTARMLRSLDDAKFSLALARVLRDTVGLSSSIARHIQGSLTAAASLRAQRRFLERAKK